LLNFCESSAAKPRPPEGNNDCKYDQKNFQSKNIEQWQFRPLDRPQMQ
jgi:hypothetical protein